MRFIKICVHLFTLIHKHLNLCGTSQFFLSVFFRRFSTILLTTVHYNFIALKYFVLIKFSLQHNFRQQIYTFARHEIILPPFCALKPNTPGGQIDTNTAQKNMHTYVCSLRVCIFTSSTHLCGEYKCATYVINFVASAQIRNGYICEIPTHAFLARSANKILIERISMKWQKALATCNNKCEFITAL